MPPQLAALASWSVQRSPRRLVLLDSGIEALSCLELEERSAPEVAAHSCYLGCAGRPKPDQRARIAAWASHSGATVALAFNDDPAGMEFCAYARNALVELGIYAECIGILAPPAWDWNLALKLRKGVRGREVLRWEKEQEVAEAE